LWNGRFTILAQWNGDDHLPDATVRSMDVEQRLHERAGDLTPSQRRIGEVVLASPQIVAFGTVADVARAAGVGTATVVRFAVALGYDGYTELQAYVRRDVSGQLRPAAERIRDRRRSNAEVELHSELERRNVQSTLAAADGSAVRAAVRRLADEDQPVLVLSGVASRGVALQFVGDLDLLRGGVQLLDGTQIDIIRTIALADRATLVVLDLRRYERWLLQALAEARRHGAWVLAVSDSVLSPLASAADSSFVVAAESTGPIDSHVGTLALLNLLVVDVAAARRDDATVRLDRLESAWQAADALTDDGR
jgi:DNA-binding MurR/RpiR family transcriptional regulator